MLKPKLWENMKGYKVVSKRLSALVLFVVLLVTAVVLQNSAKATDPPALTGSTSATAVYAQSSIINNLQITGTGNPTVSVKLHVSHGTLAMLNVGGLVFTGSNSGATLQFSGLLSAVNTDLLTLTYSQSGFVADVIEASLVDPGEVFFPDTGHLYEYVSASTTWDQAKVAAEARSKYGATGYLTTITSQAENDFVAARLTNAGWMGASDSVTEGDWKWVTGPELGTSFWSGASGGSAVSSRYANWSAGEPNNASNEDCAQFLTGGTGKWNDLPCSTFSLPGYVVEYGAPGNMPTVSSLNVNVTMQRASVNISTCTQLEALGGASSDYIANINLTQDIDCQGVSMAPLFTSTPFNGTFDGHGFKILNINIDGTGTSYTGIFGRADSGAIFKNIILDGGTVISNGTVGALVGQAINVNFDNITSNVNITGGQQVGGLIGYFSANSTANKGDLTDIYIRNISTTGTVTGNRYVGGLVGYYSIFAIATTLEKSFSTSNVIGDYGGGLVGGVSDISISDPNDIIFQDVYSTGSVTKAGIFGVNGGIAGSLFLNLSGSQNTAFTLRRAYTSSNVTSNSAIGGLFGSVSGPDDSRKHVTLQNIFVASTTSGGAISSSYPADSGITTLGNIYYASGNLSGCDLSNTLTGCTSIDTTANPNYFKNNYANLPMSTWDFTNIWRLNAGKYPTFRTSIDVSGDSDGDSIVDSAEDAHVNSGDMNNDGIIDSTQPNVTGFVSSITSKPVALETSPLCTVSTLTAARESDQAVKDTAFDYPNGLMHFVIDCGVNGFSATIKQYYYDVTKADLVLRKYNSASHSYSAIAPSTIDQITIAGKTVTRVTYQITDGSSADEDGSTNGSITDPAGLAIASIQAPNTGLGGGQFGPFTLRRLR